MISTAATDPIWEEFREYTARNSLTGYERRILWDWIRSSHGVYNTAGHGYLPRPTGPHPIDAHGLDWELPEDMEGIARDEKDAYLKPYTVYGDPAPERAAINNAGRTPLDLTGTRNRCLGRELFHLWEFVWQEGLGNEAREFVDERKSDEIPFEW